MDRLHAFIMGIILFLLLGGCSFSAISSNSGCYSNMANYDVICDSKNHYTYYQPSWINSTDWQSRGITMDTYDFPLSIEEKKEWEKYGHNVPLNATCAAKTTGIFDSPLSVTNTNSAWAKVDFFEKFDSRGQGWIDYGDPYPLCATLGSYEARYAFCSEKNGKTVVICISQMKDDPAMAKQIFETFRWTE